jgi:hypothetical protein
MYRTPGTHFIGGWVGPSAGVDVVNQGLETPVFQFRRDEMKVFSSPLSQNGLWGAPTPFPFSQRNGTESYYKSGAFQS